MVQLVFINKASGRIIRKPARNIYQAERYARDLLRTYRTDAAIVKTLAPGTMTLRHRQTGDTAVITWGDEDGVDS